MSRGFIEGDMAEIWSEAEGRLKKAHELNDNDFEFIVDGRSTIW